MVGVLRLALQLPPLQRDIQVGRSIDGQTSEKTRKRREKKNRFAEKTKMAFHTAVEEGSLKEES